MRDFASHLDGFASPLGVPVRFYPANVFGDGSNGLLQDYSATTGLYSDNLGATPLTAPDMGVGLVADRSRVRSPVTAYGGAQASAGFRPKWGRAPVSRRNLLLIGGTAMLNNSDGSALIDNAPTGFTPPVDASFQRITKNVSNTQFYTYRTSQPGSASGQSVFSIHVLPDAGCTEIGFHTDTNAQGRMRYNLSTGVVTKGVNTADAGAVVLGGGWYRIWSKTAGVSATNIWTVVANTATVGAAASFVIGGHQSEASALTAYQKTLSAYDMTEAGVPSYGYIRPDRTDDVLTTTLTLAQTGDVAVFGRTGSKIEIGLIYGAGATFSLGATTVTGMSAGVLAAVGDVVGVLAIGRALTTAEKASTLAYFQARGAGAWL